MFQTFIFLRLIEIPLLPMVTLVLSLAVPTTWKRLHGPLKQYDAGKSRWIC